jgi:hypothetical protein
VTTASASEPTAPRADRADRADRALAAIDGGVPPGTAALRLAGALDWLGAATPDPALVDRVTIPGEQLALDTKRDLNALRRAQEQRVVVGVQRHVARVASYGPGTAEVFVDVSAGESRVVARDGAVVSRTRLAGTRWVYFVAWYPQHNWVLADAFRLLAPTGAP